MTENVSGQDALTIEEAEVDRHLDFRGVLSQVLTEETFPSSQVTRFEITLLANGEATYRVWTRDAEEPWEGTYTD